MADIFSQLWIILAIVCAVETLMLLVVWRYAKTITWTWIKAGLIHKNYAVTIRGTVDKKFKFDNPEISPQDPHKWDIFNGNIKLPREVKNGHVRRGPDGVDMVLITDDCTSSIDIDEVQKERIGSTPAYVQQLEDMAYANGYQDGFKKSNPGTLMSDIKENLGSILVIMFMLGLGFYVFYDQIIRGPGLISEIQTCKDTNTLLVAKCSPHVDLTAELNSRFMNAVGPTTTTIPKAATGAVVK